jgi:hypothetical protein
MKARTTPPGKLALGMNKAKILGYIVLSIFIPMMDGRTLKLRE